MLHHIDQLHHNVGCSDHQPAGECVPAPPGHVDQVRGEVEGDVDGVSGNETVKIIVFPDTIILLPACMTTCWTAGVTACMTA